MARLAALEAEVKAEAEARRARREVALAEIRTERAAPDDSRATSEARQVQPVTRRSAARDVRAPGDDHGLAGAIELAGRATRLKDELATRPRTGDKSWVTSGLASLALGPLGWLYAGAWREAVPASAAWLLVATLASKLLPTVLLLPVLMVALPLSGAAGVAYALQHNRAGKRQRLFGAAPPKLLARRPPGDE